MEDMQHIILTALARLMSTADASARLVEIQGRKCQFFSTLNLDSEMTASIIEALKLAAVGYLFPFSYTPKFRVTVSTQQTALGYMPGVRFSVNYASSVPYFFCCNHSVPMEEIFVFNFGAYGNLYKSEQHIFIPKIYLGSVMKVLWSWKNKQLPDFIREIEGDRKFEEEASPAGASDALGLSVDNSEQSAEGVQ
jgi:hypothetical protein